MVNIFINRTNLFRASCFQTTRKWLASVVASCGSGIQALEGLDEKGVQTDRWWRVDGGGGIGVSEWVRGFKIKNRPSQQEIASNLFWWIALLEIG